MLCVARMGGWDFESGSAKTGAEVVCVGLFGCIRTLDIRWGGFFFVEQERQVSLELASCRYVLAASWVRECARLSRGVCRLERRIQPPFTLV